MTVLSPSGLETNTYGMPGWVHIWNANVDRLNRLLLMIQELQDVDTDNLKNGGILTWDANASKWKIKTYG